MTNEIAQNEVDKSHIKPPGEVQYYIETSKAGIVLLHIKRLL